MCSNGMKIDELAGNSMNGAKLPHKPVIHPPADGPLCVACGQLDKSFFDVNCAGCQLLLCDEATTVSELFAILRQWIPQTQQNVLMITEQVTMIDSSLCTLCLDSSAEWCFVAE